MKIQLLKSDRSYQTITFDETKMIPDPKFVRVLEWGGVDPVPDLAPKFAGEKQEDFDARKEKHDTAVAAQPAAISDREAQIQVEAQRLYELEFDKPVPVLVSEKTI